jgi:hypothetical protein
MPLSFDRYALYDACEHAELDARGLSSVTGIAFDRIRAFFLNEASPTVYELALICQKLECSVSSLYARHVENVYDLRGKLPTAEQVADTPEHAEHAELVSFPDGEHA